MTLTQNALDGWREVLDSDGFGPITAMHTHDDIGAVQVELDETAPLSVLLRWARLIDVVDQRVGVYDTSDEYVRLHLRGLLDKVGPVMITQPLRRSRRAQQAQTAWEQIQRYGVVELLQHLSEMD